MALNIKNLIVFFLYASLVFSQEWSEPVKLDLLLGEGCYRPSHPFLTRDNSRLYFTAYVGGTTDIFYCDRTENGWGEMMSLPDYINTAASEHSPSLTADNKTLYFVRWSSRNSWEILFSEWENGEWGRPVNIGPPINTPGMEFGCCISSGGDTLVFEGPHYWETMYPPDVMYSVKTDMGWSYPKLFFEDYDGNSHWESDPFISTDGKSLWFMASFHRDWGRDLIFSKWDGEKWTVPVQVGPPVNTEQAEVAPALSSDELELFFARIYDKGDSIRGEEIYVSKRLSNIVNNNKIEKHLGCFKVYPNPFNSSTRLSFQVEIPGHVLVQIYDILGRKVKTQVDGHKEKGHFIEIWNGKNLMEQPVSSGVYFCVIQTRKRTKSHKVLLLR
ncbi:T9SS type A sorting domain-containing protein [candidate division KSB1 bacterium]|nr:T9SS type A sorting domain-containing protein [candidate division KSB1 bacterium]